MKGERAKPLNGVVVANFHLLLQAHFLRPELDGAVSTTADVVFYFVHTFDAIDARLKRKNQMRSLDCPNRMRVLDYFQQFVHGAPINASVQRAN